MCKVLQEDASHQAGKRLSGLFAFLHLKAEWIWSLTEVPEKSKKKENKKRLNYIDTTPPSRPPSDGEHLHFNRFRFLPPPPLLPPCLSRSLTLLDWTFLLQKQFSIIICNATPQCRMQMLLALAAPAWQLLTEHRCGRPLRQNKVKTANNVITQSLHVGVHSLRAAVDSGHCWHRLGRAPDVRGCQQRNTHNLISSAVQDSLNCSELQMNAARWRCELNVNERTRHVTRRWWRRIIFTKRPPRMSGDTGGGGKHDGGF